MQFLVNAGSFIIRTLFRLALLVVGAVFALVLVGVGLMGLVYVLLKALLTGRKPVLVTTFMQFRQASQQFKRGGWNRGPQSANDEHAATGEVIEGQSFEVRDDTALPHQQDMDKH